MEIVKTIFLFTLMTLLMIFIGNLIGGQTGMIIAFVIACGMNFFSYFYSDKLILKHYNAISVDKKNAKGIYDIVEKLTQRANIPMPKIYIIPSHTANAFATGRNPKNAAIALTEGLLDLLTPQEVEAVIAHELSHVRHYDILIGTIVATMAGAIAILANFLQFGAIFGNNNKEGQNPIVMIIAAIIVPFAATIIQMAVSRNREYLADEGAAKLTNHPEWLQSALIKLENISQRKNTNEATQSTAHMFIINPLRNKNISFNQLFSTHPTTNERINRLEKLKLNTKKGF